jgi:hypothetical protein
LNTEVSEVDGVTIDLDACEELTVTLTVPPVENAKFSEVTFVLGVTVSLLEIFLAVTLAPFKVN